MTDGWRRWRRGRCGSRTRCGSPPWSRGPRRRTGYSPGIPTGGVMNHLLDHDRGRWGRLHGSGGERHRRRRVQRHGHRLAGKGQEGRGRKDSGQAERTSHSPNRRAANQAQGSITAGRVESPAPQSSPPGAPPPPPWPPSPSLGGGGDEWVPSCSERSDFAVEEDPSTERAGAGAGKS